MTDIENIIITRIDNVLNTAGYSNIVGSMDDDFPASFPWVFVEQSDQYESLQYHNSSRAKNHDVVVFDIDIYSNKNFGSKAECKDIAGIIDTEMVSLGFERTTSQPLRPSSDMYKSRRFLRYRAKIDDNKYIYHN